MECFGTTDFDNNSRLVTLSMIIISGLHCTHPAIDSFKDTLCLKHSGIIQTAIMGNIQNTNQASCNTPLSESFKVHFNKGCRYLNISGLSSVHTSNKQMHTLKYIYAYIWSDRIGRLQCLNIQSCSFKS